MLHKSCLLHKSCTVSFIVTLADYIYLFDVCDSENKLSIYLTGEIIVVLALHIPIPYQTLLHTYIMTFIVEKYEN